LAPDDMAFRDDTIFVHNYRFFFAFDTSKRDPEQSNLKWVYSFPRHDVVASVHTGESLVLVTDNGKLINLDLATGSPVAKQDLGLEVRGATFDAAGHRAPGEAKGKPNLRASLIEVIWDPDRRFQAVKLFCVEELARLKSGKVSQDLVKIVTHEGVDPAVYERAGEVLVKRHDKGAIPLYIKTLKTKYNFVKGTEARAVDVMARAVGELKAPEAVKPLLMHLADHETPLPAVVEVVKALTAIGDESIREPFRDFLLTYRCDPLFRKYPAALNLVAEALLEMGTEEERQLLSFVENDPHSLASLRTYLGEALRQTKPTKKKPAQKKAEVKASGEEKKRASAEK
jgi:HEAT repeat protein